MCYYTGISLAMAHCVEAGLCKDVECRAHVEAFIKDTVDTAVDIIYFMLDMLSGNRTTEASMTVLCPIHTNR